MRAVLSSVVLLLAATSVHAHSMRHIDPRNHTCAEVQSMVNSEGSVAILGSFGYEVHHNNLNSCGPFHTPEFKHVRTADKRFCAAGYVCVIRQGGE